MGDTLRDRIGRSIKALDRRRTPEVFEREFLRDNPSHADEYMRLKAKPVPKAGPAAEPAIQLDLIPPDGARRKRRRRNLYSVRGKQ